MSNIIDNSFLEHQQLTGITLSKCYKDIEMAGEYLKKIFNPDPSKTNFPISGNKLLIFGNGGSASDSQHIAAEFTNRFTINRKPLPAIALTTDTSALTAISNDFKFNMIFSKQIEALGKEGDVAIGISTSGTSPNVIRGLSKAKDLNMRTILLTSHKIDSSTFDITIRVPSDNTARIQEMHILIGHILCQIVDELYKDDVKSN